MNSIALLELIALDKSKIGNFSKEEYTQIKKELVAQKETHPEIEDSDITQLLKILKTHSEAFQVILNNRILFNFFAKKEYPRSYFINEIPAVETEKVKAFVQNFFTEELNTFFIQNFETNKFEELELLVESKDYFPDHLIFTLRQHVLDKLDDAITALKPPYGNLSRVLYIKNSSFFTFLSSIKNEEIEQKVKQLLETVTAIYKMDYSSELANRTFAAMNNYVAFDSDFTQKIKSNKNISDANFGTHIPKRRNLTWVYIVVGLFVFIRVVVFFSTNNFNNFETNDDVVYEDEIEYTPEPRQLDRYYTNMKFNIDSFMVFLAEYKASDIKQMTQDVSLKTGENPFETFYENPPTGDSNHFITVTNKTKYDMVLLENTVMYDSIKMPRSAHYVKAGEHLEINFNSDYSQTIFNIYLGKKWATFQTKSNHLFIRNHSIVEYRFSELVPSAKEILHTDYGFLNDAVIFYSNDGLDIESPGATINPLSQNRE
ncbi:hypothetical protein [Flavobacterium sp. 25HG05S-40]|uniref:hypothetical protein n=1 Tax=Flavobacterium sp. 25HG05S-40 TaxID=3458682 RepID=UPI004043D54C